MLHFIYQQSIVLQTDKMSLLCLMMTNEGSIWCFHAFSFNDSLPFTNIENQAVASIEHILQETFWGSPVVSAVHITLYFRNITWSILDLAK